MRKLYSLSAINSLIALAWLIVQSPSCRKFVEVPAPVTSSNAENIFDDDVKAASVLTGVYADMSNDDGGTSGVTAISVLMGLYADELTLYNTADFRYLPWYQNNLTPSVTDGFVWSKLYYYIFIANTAIEKLQTSSLLTPAIKNQLIGEAKFIRAFCFFYLTNLYGDVPLILGGDWKTNSTFKRNTTQQVFAQIVADLLDAKRMLSPNYLTSDALTAYKQGAVERVRPTKFVATAPLSRVYLYSEDWNNASIEASEVIDAEVNGEQVYHLNMLNDVFKKNSSEVIWSLQPVKSGQDSNTGDGRLFVLPATGPGGSAYPITLSKNLVEDFEENDKRLLNWVGSVSLNGDTFYFPNKYKIGQVDVGTQEYIVVFRLSEQYLIRAEANARLNNLQNSLADLNVVRNKAGLSSFLSSDNQAVLSAIFHERRVELFTEWGHRWLDMKRTGNADQIMQVVANLKGTAWSPYKKLFPILKTELDKSPNLVQTPSY